MRRTRGWGEGSGRRTLGDMKFLCFFFPCRKRNTKPFSFKSFISYSFASLKLSPRRIRIETHHDFPRLLPPCKGPCALLRSEDGDCPLGFRATRQQTAADAAICHSDRPI